MSRPALAARALRSSGREDLRCAPAREPALAEVDHALRACGRLAAEQYGGPGFWTGFGHDQIGSNLTNSPSNRASSFVQISFIAATCSPNFR